MYYTRRKTMKKQFDFYEAVKLGHFDSAKRWYPDNPIATVYIEEEGFRAPSRAWNLSYLKAIQTQKFYKFYTTVMQMLEYNKVAEQVDSIRDKWDIPEGQFILPLFSKHEMAIKMQLELLKVAYNDDFESYTRLSIMVQLDNEQIEEIREAM
jgi:hypothetical protein